VKAIKCAEVYLVNCTQLNKARKNLKTEIVVESANRLVDTTFMGACTLMEGKTGQE